MRFTILTPSYNRAHLLFRIYECLCAQTFRDFEWIIVDDGSTDNTRELVASWQTFRVSAASHDDSGGGSSGVQPRPSSEATSSSRTS